MIVQERCQLISSCTVPRKNLKTCQPRRKTSGKLKRQLKSCFGISGMHFRRLGRRSSAKFQCSFSPLITNFATFSDFGGIFEELLPGNFAKLRPPEGQDLMDGLEVKVQLGTVWKQSLTRAQRRTKVCVTLILQLDFEMMLFDSLWLYSSSR